MRLVSASAVAIAVALFIPTVHSQQPQDADRKVAGGGITVKGWQGKVDAGNKQGLTINDSKFAPEGGGFRVTTGAAGIFWNPANTAKGDYTVKGTFKEAKQTYNHPHPFGVFIAGKNLDTEAPSYLYCVAYRNGNFIVNQFVDGKVTRIVPRTQHKAVDVATGPEDDVTQEVGWTVKGSKAECTINGQAVHSIDRADPAGTVKLDSFDGVYGIRISHNSDAVVSGLGMGK
jgi:hypothetical protein